MKSTPTIGRDARVRVAVGVVHNAAGEVLLQQRGAAQACAGQWEFPGGKIEGDETPRAALRRELREELGVDALHAEHLMDLDADYSHANVRLHVYKVTKLSGDAVGREGQAIVWLDYAAARKLDLLRAVHPILDKLEG